MKAALLLIDCQNDFLNSPGLQPPRDHLVRNATALLNLCRKRGIPVFHIWTTVRKDDDRRLPHQRKSGKWVCEEGTPGHQPPAALRPCDNETVIHKSGFDAFLGTSLAAQLSELKCGEIIVAGVHLHACVRTAAVGGMELNLKVSVAEDSTASNDPIHAAATRRWLSERCVSFCSLSELERHLDGRASAEILHYSPRKTKELAVRCPIGGASEVMGAVASAREAALAWRKTPLALRQRIFQRVAERVEAAAESLARQMAVEIGKPISQGVEEVRRAAANVRDVLRRASNERMERREAGGWVRYRPVGTVALISPWNNPVAIPLGKIAPALLYGNTVVWKPAPAGLGIARAMERLLLDAGLPENCVALLTGDHNTGGLLASAEGIDAVTLTGSLLSGYAVQERCARRVIPLQAELSGNNAAIVWEDANLEHAAAQVSWGAFGFAGQRCTANRRVIVAANRRDEFLAEVESAARRLPWGDPMNSSTEIGPVISAGKRDELAAQLAQASADSREVIFPHRSHSREPWVAEGAYAPPAMVGCADSKDPLVQEESMAPLLVVQTAEDFDEAIQLCNGVRHGLSAAIFTNSASLREKFLEEAQAGMLKLNSSTAGADATLPFTGWKASGIGPPEHGEGDRLFYTRTQAVYGTHESSGNTVDEEFLEVQEATHEHQSRK